LIDLIVERVGYRAHLDKQHSHDAAERWENVEELKVRRSGRVSNDLR
jgi:hypothetical protein